MTENSAKQETMRLDPFEFWRQFYEANEQAWTKAVKDAITTKDYAEAQGRMLETFLAFQKMMREGMSAQLNSLNLPTRDDVARLGELQLAVEEKIDRLEDRLYGIEERVDRAAGLEKRLEKLDKRLAGLEEALDKRLGSMMDGTEKRLEKLDRRLASMDDGSDKRLASMSEGTEKRLAGIDKRLASMEERIERGSSESDSAQKRPARASAGGKEPAGASESTPSGNTKKTE